MKKNAFTLVELLGVIAILGLIVLIAVPTVENSLKNSKQKLYETQISNIESGLKGWATDNLFILPDNEDEIITITLYQLKQGNYVSKDIINPLTDKLFPNDMLLTITKKSNSYEYVVLVNTGTQTDETEINPDAPILILNGSSTQYVEIYDLYTDLGVTAINSEGEVIDQSNITVNISGHGTDINTNEFGSYAVKYYVTDPDNGYRTTAVRSVVVNDRTKPSLSIPSNIVLEPDEVSSFNPRTDATAMDNYDGDLTSQIQITGNLSILPGIYYLTYTVTDSSGNKTTGKRTINVGTIYADTSGASIPELTTGMIPVIYDGTNWVKARLIDKWYDYNSKEWANAVTVTSTNRDTYLNAAPGTVIPISDINTMWVWIPRYKYAIPTGTGERSINIVFESKIMTKSTGNAIGINYRTHPAFTFGTTEVNGIWVGKFETTGAIGSPTILPNTASLRSQTVKAMYDASRAMQNNATYGFSTDGNIHMAKGSEWGAAAYLSHSQYGKNSEIFVNPSSSYITGRGGTTVSQAGTTDASGSASSTLYSYDGKQCNTKTGYICTGASQSTYGMASSTTGNIYGAYDMSGGAWEYTMSMYRPTDATSVGDSSGFGATTTNGTLPPSEYWDRYTTEVPSTACSSGICYGSALSETSGWYGGITNFIFTTNPWSIRGGYYGDEVGTGAFSFDNDPGAASSYESFRLVQLKL